MARSKERRVRVKHDFYETPPWATVELIKRLAVVPDPDFQMTGTALEPCTGNGAIARILETTGMRVWTNDIDPKRPADYQMDARDDAVYSATMPDWIVTNPPWSYALDIAKASLEWARQGTAMLLRISFLEPTLKRGWWLKDHPPDFLLHLPRISYDGDGNFDAVHGAWFVWYGPDASDKLPRGHDWVLERQPRTKQPRLIEGEETAMRKIEQLRLAGRSDPAGETGR